MVLDVRMQLDINVQMRHIPRTPPTDERRERHRSEGVEEIDNMSDSSWTTFEEQEVEEQELEGQEVDGQGDGGQEVVGQSEH